MEVYKCMVDTEIKMYEKNWVKIAICIARMYGVSECLSTLPNIPLDEIADMVIDWTDEYIENGRNLGDGNDIVDFFETKIKNLDYGY